MPAASATIGWWCAGGIHLVGVQNGCQAPLAGAASIPPTHSAILYTKRWRLGLHQNAPARRRPAVMRLCSDAPPGAWMRVLLRSVYDDASDWVAGVGTMR